jgi:hypothetical protein
MMKHNIKKIALVLGCAIVFVACDNDDSDDDMKNLKTACFPKKFQRDTGNTTHGTCQIYQTDLLTI